MVYGNQMCVNLIIRKFHTEDYSTYTVIKILNQEHENKLSKYHFVFNLSNKHNVAIRFVSGTIFIVNIYNVDISYC